MLNNTKFIEIDAAKIFDWESFHDVFYESFGFPGFYGRNMNAWIDCMSCLDDPDSGMTKFTVPKDGIVVLKLYNSEIFREKCPEQFAALYECVAFVNLRYIETNSSPILSLMMIGHF
jgi:hypothetical protein